MFPHKIHFGRNKTQLLEIHIIIDGSVILLHVTFNFKKHVLLTY